MFRSFGQFMLRLFVALFMVFGSLFLAATIWGIGATDLALMFGVRINNELPVFLSPMGGAAMEWIIWVGNGTLAITFYAAAFLFARMIKLTARNAQPTLDAAALLIRNKDTAGARLLLATIPDEPKAREWLAKLG